MTEYVHVGAHADILASGQPVGPGDHIKTESLDLESSDQTLIDSGTLVDVASFAAADNQQTADELRIRAAELGIEGRSKLKADELRQAVAEREANQEV